jgi:hypothetical protein
VARIGEHIRFDSIANTDVDGINEFNLGITNGILYRRLARFVDTSRFDVPSN